MSDLKTKQLTHGALMMAIFFVLLLIVLYVPLLNLITIFFIPLPFIVHMVRFDLHATLLTGVASLALTVILTPLPAVFITIAAVTVGMVMGHFYAQKKGPFLPMLAGMVTYIVNYVLLFLVSFFLLDINLLDSMEQMLRESLLMTENTAEFWNMPLDEELQMSFEEMVEGITYVFPAIMILSALMMSAVHHGISRSVLHRLGQRIQVLPPFREWNMPKSMLYYYLIALILVILGVLEEGGTLSFFVINLHMILEILLLIQGLTMIAHFAHSKGWGKIVPVGVIVLAVLIPLVANIVRIIGIFDLGFGLKQRVK